MQKLKLQNDHVIDTVTFLNTLQDYQITNIQNILGAMLVRAGVFFLDGNNMLAAYDSAADGDLIFSVQAGSGVFRSNEIIKYSSTQMVSVAEPEDAGTYYFGIQRVAATDTPYPRYPSTLDNLNIREYNTYVGFLDAVTPNDADKLLLASVEWDGAAVTSVTDARIKAILGNFSVAQFSELVDVLVNGKLFGKTIQLQDATPAAPANVRITRITGADTTLVTTDDNFKTEKLSRVIQKGYTTNKARVTFEWGWKVEGTGGNGIFTANDNTLSVNEDDLVGQMLYVGTTECYITANQATSVQTTVITVKDAAGQSIDLTGLNGTSGSPAIIHANADSYIVSATPVDSGGGAVDDQAVENIVAMSASPVRQVATLELPLGVKHVFSVQAEKGGIKSLVAEMPAGSFTQNSAVQNYNKPFIVKIPDLSAGEQTAAKVSADQTLFGFLVSINGWESATAFEVGWTTRNSGVDFNNPIDNVIVTHNRLVEVPTNGIREYQVAARPLISGQVVGATKTDTVVSGGSGQSSNEKTVPWIEVDMRGSIRQFENNLPGILVLKAGEPEVDWALNEFAGKRLEDADLQQFEIVENDNTGTVVIRPISTAVEDVIVTDDVYVGNVGSMVNTGTVEEPNYVPNNLTQRLIYRHTFESNVVITRITFDCRNTSGSQSTPGKIRLYQLGRENYAQALEVNKPDFLFAKTFNMPILGTYGNYQLVVDCWDSSGVGNQVSMSGILTIFYRDRAAVDGDDAVIAQQTV